MSDTLRAQILAMLDDHSRAGSAQSKSDKDIATATGQDVGEIQRPLDILESEDLVALAKAMGPTYGAQDHAERHTSDGPREDCAAAAANWPDGPLTG